MYSLLSGFYDYYMKRPSFNVLIIGLDNAGKTTLLERIKILLHGGVEKASGIIIESSETVPTIGLNLSKCDFHGIQFQFWDLGGTEGLQVLWEKYYSEAHVVFFVIDASIIDDSERTQQVLKTLSKLVKNKDIEGVPMAILANKQDLLLGNSDDDVDLNDDARLELKISQLKELFNPLMERVEARESKIFSVSAKTGRGILETLEWMFKAVENNSIHRPANQI